MTSVLLGNVNIPCIRDMVPLLPTSYKSHVKKSKRKKRQKSENIKSD